MHKSTDIQIKSSFIHILQDYTYLLESSNLIGLILRTLILPYPTKNGNFIEKYVRLSFKLSIFSEILLIFTRIMGFLGLWRDVALCFAWLWLSVWACYSPDKGLYSYSTLHTSQIGNILHTK